MRYRKANTADLSSDLSQLLDDLREVLESKEHAADPALSLLLNKVVAALEKVREASSHAVDQTKAVAQCADAYVHESPWKVIGGALAVGAVLGCALSRR